jgi:hypothetical protein
MGMTTMKRIIWLGLISCGLVCVATAYGLRLPEAKAQRARAESQWEYKVGVFSYNPGEKLTDEQRRAFYERTLNEQAREGWEVIGSVLDRDTIQTVGGAVTTRDTTSFVAYRRPRR